MAEYKSKFTGAEIDAGVERAQRAATSWNDLPDKPVVMQGGDTLTWDGDTSGKVVAGDVFYKVSNATPAVSDFSEGATVGFADEEGEGSEAIAYDDVSAASNSDGFIALGIIYIVPANNYDASNVGIPFVFPEKGTYFALGTTHFTIPGYTGFGQEKIAPSHLYQPDWNQNDATQPDYVKNKPFGDMPTGGDTITFDMDTINADLEAGNFENYVVVGEALIKVSDATPTLDDFQNGIRMLENGSQISYSYEQISEIINEYGGELFIEVAYIAPSDNYTSQTFDITFPEKGVYVSRESYVTSITLPGYTGFPYTKKIDEKYMSNIVQEMYYNDNDANDVYIYADSTLSVKVTKDEFNEAVKKGVIVIVSPNFRTTLFPVCASWKGENNTYYPYSRIFAVVAEYPNWTPTYRMFYTAEYTPPTT